MTRKPNRQPNGIAAVANALGVSQSTVRAMADRNELHAVRVGNQRRFDMREVARLARKMGGETGPDRRTSRNRRAMSMSRRR